MPRLGSTFSSECDIILAFGIAPWLNSDSALAKLFFASSQIAFSCRTGGANLGSDQMRSDWASILPRHVLDPVVLSPDLLVT